jgi:hypothetical protein
LHDLLHYPIVIDGRNLFDPAVMAEHGFLYNSVGRADVSHDFSSGPKSQAAPKPPHHSPNEDAVKVP